MFSEMIITLPITMTRLEIMTVRDNDYNKETENENERDRVYSIGA
jgi:hypothetical protein